jgi:hypothetical protein
LRLVDFWSIDTAGEALDEVDVGLVHLPEELPRVGRQRLDVPPLALGEDRVEGEAGLPGPREAGEDDEAVPRQVEIDAREVVLTSALNDETIDHVQGLLVSGESAPRWGHARADVWFGCLSPGVLHAKRDPRQRPPVAGWARPGGGSGRRPVRGAGAVRVAQVDG